MLSGSCNSDKYFGVFIKHVFLITVEYNIFLFPMCYGNIKFRNHSFFIVL